MTAPVDLGPTTDHLARIVAGIDDDVLGRPTPCTGRTVGDLVDHCLGLAAAFTASARKEDRPELHQPPPPWSGANLPRDWGTVLPERLQSLALAWRQPTAVEGMATAGGVTMPASVMNLVALDEIFLHGWDLAVATKQPFEPDETALHVVHEFLSESTKESPEGTPGLFGPVVPVPDDASLLDRALGLSGRDPAYR